MTTTTKASRFMQKGARFYNIRGQQLPGTTSITGMMNKPALPNWAAKLTRERMCDEAADLYANTAMQFLPGTDRDKFRAMLWKLVDKRAFHNEAAREAADLGTLAHAQCEWIVNRARGEVVGPDPITAARATGTDAQTCDRALWASMAFDQWVTDHDVRFIESEVVVVDDVVGYAGTADLVAFVDGVRSIIDLKTSSGVWPEMYLQLAAYWNAYNVSTARVSDNVERAYILRLPKKLSDPEFEAVEVTDLPYHFDAFKALAVVFSWHQGVTK